MVNDACDLLGRRQSYSLSSVDLFVNCVFAAARWAVNSHLLPYSCVMHLLRLLQLQAVLSVVTALLHVADCVDLVRLVLEERSAETLELDEAGSDGDTALHFLAKGKKHPSNRQALIKLLLEHGALPNLKNEQGKRPLDYIHSKKSNIHQQLSSVSKEPCERFFVCVCTIPDLDRVFSLVMFLLP